MKSTVIFRNDSFWPTTADIDLKPERPLLGVLHLKVAHGTRAFTMGNENYLYHGLLLE